MITRGEMPQVRRVCVLAWGGAAVSWELSSPGGLAPSLATCAAFLLLATGCALHIRRGLVAELRRSQEIAGAAQRALLRPLPGRIDGLALAAAQLSASRGAAVGGDLYEAVPTGYGVRVVIGDVRGHGLAALGAFREAAYDEPSLGGVLRRMERALARHVRDRGRAEHPSACPAEPQSPSSEEFVTVLLLQIAPDGSLLALNRGHPWPHLLRPAASGEPCGPVPAGSSASPASAARGLGRSPGRRGEGGAGIGSAQRARVRALDGGETWPPLGVVPVDPDVRPQECGMLRPGEALVLHTDGAEDARDHAGRFFDLPGALAAQPALTPARLVAGVHAALLRHTSGRLADDVALLVLRNDR
ncbi:serine/threonine-protein phosphatase [Streptomyces sp. NBC_01551]|uniref:PP2C family protein-serine/threonine phosphatase n=1 Tax=Streptomyces sp. NBC_01551 TaxID=2975876 RepID=UPI00224D714B|nr:PP2C family protein-serine/threonine phosphatase [Streptomyces sp. NBC_01551]MCX4524930.1 serine/threonine-protein phosphatase [Streptomyces sp. NBC_01551]